MIRKLLIIGATVGGNMWLVSPFLLGSGIETEVIVMGGWFVAIVPVIYLTWRFEPRRLP